MECPLAPTSYDKLSFALLAHIPLSHIVRHESILLQTSIPVSSSLDFRIKGLPNSSLAWELA